MASDWSDNILISELSDEPALSEELSAVYDRLSPRATKHLVLNFSGVTYVSSSHLALLLRLRKRLVDSGRSMVLCSMSDQVWSVFMLTGLDRVFRTAQDPMTALATLQLESEQGLGD
ncbi:MAG: STAS domain-containing protein [Phycisphaerales bacterium]|nr:STAS domain-containing protein [Phycisphaerales bacterium]